MKSYSTIYILLLACIVIALGSCQQNHSCKDWQRECYARVAASLDSTDAFAAMQEKVLDEYRESAKAAKTADEAFLYNLKLAEHYVESNTAKALQYQRRSYDIARGMANHDKLVESMLMGCKIYNEAGHMEPNRKTLDLLRAMSMSPERRVEYYNSELIYWQNRAIFYNLPMPSPESIAYADSILRSGVNLSEAMRLHATFWHETEKANKQKLLKRLCSFVDATPTDDANYKTLTSEAAVLANDLGDKHTMLTLAAKNIDAALRSGDKRIDMLWYVTIDAIQARELDYSEKFMGALSDFNDVFPCRLYIPIYSTQHELYKALQERERKMAQVTLVFAIAVTLLLLAAIGAIIYARRISAKRKQLYAQLTQQYALVKQMTAQLKQEQDNLIAANDSLKTQSQQIMDSEQQLREANYLKEEYIGQMFAMCADYLHKIEEMKKDINRKLRAGQIDMAMQASKPNNDSDQKALADLWERFDEIFLRIFPDFTEQFNSLLQPDKQVQLRDPQHLNTDLRIHALVRLGINNSVHISQILGLSAQTVYNARQKMRARALPSEQDFPTRVKNLAVGSVG